MKTKSISTFISIFIGVISSLIATILWQLYNNDQLTFNIFTDIKIPLYFFTLYSIVLLIFYKFVRTKVELHQNEKELGFIKKLDASSKQYEVQISNLNQKINELEIKVSDYKKIDNFILALISNSGTMRLELIIQHISFHAPEFHTKDVRSSIGHLTAAGIIIGDNLGGFKINPSYLSKIQRN